MKSACKKLTSTLVFFATTSQALALHIVLHHIESHPADAALWLDTTGYLAPGRLATFASRSVRLRNTAYVFALGADAWMFSQRTKESLRD